MKRNFCGEHFMIESMAGRSQPKLDCMFFPCTIGDEIKAFDGAAPRPPKIDKSDVDQILGDSSDNK